jgi:uncharacterized protein (DUF2126 family)
LVFGISNRWTGQSLDGLTHHTFHPGGQNYETLPVTAKEAGAGRRTRFQPFGHTPAPMSVPEPLPSKESPRSPDLRRAE